MSAVLFNEIPLESRNKDIIHFPVAITQCSGLLKDLMENHELRNSVVCGIPVPVRSLTTITLEKIKDWYMVHIESPIGHQQDGQRSLCVRNVATDGRELDILELEPKLLLDVLSGAAFLDIEALINASCQKVAEKIKNKCIKNLNGVPDELQLRISACLTPFALQRAARENIVPLNRTLEEHIRIWTTIFSTDEWFLAAIKHRANPILIGYGLVNFQESLASGAPVYLALASMDLTGDLQYDCRDMTEFLQAHNPTDHDRIKCEVKLRNITLNFWGQNNEYSEVSDLKHIVKYEKHGKIWSAITYLRCPGVRKLCPENPRWGAKHFTIQCSESINLFSGTPNIWKVIENRAEFEPEIDITA